MLSSLSSAFFLSPVRRDVEIDEWERMCALVERIWWISSDAHRWQRVGPVSLPRTLPAKRDRESARHSAGSMTSRGDRFVPMRIKSRQSVCQKDREAEDNRIDEEENVHVWRVVFSYDSYLLTTEKTFLLFRRVSLILSLPFARSFASVCACVCPLLFSTTRRRDREGERASIACLLSRSRAFAASLSLPFPPSFPTHY